MDEIWARVGLVLGALAVAGTISLIQRRRTRRPVRSVKAADMAAGVYFFSSATCPTCERAREKLNDRLGEDGYTEFTWENEPDPFNTLDVDAVPAVAVLDEAGRGRLYPGQPDRALGALH